MTEKTELGISGTQASYWSAVSLALGVAIGNGFARFAYALILPDMRTDLAWNYSTAGLPNTWNAIGNVFGAIFALVALKKVEPRWVFCFGLVLTTLSLLLTGGFRDIEWIGLFRFFAGVGGAAAFASGGALVAKKFEHTPNRSGTAITIYFGGGGFGIALSSIAIPLLSQSLGAGSWQYSWLLLGLLAVACAIPPLVTASRIQLLPSVSSKATYSLKTSWPILLSYSFFGSGYIVYLTFAFAWMREHQISILGSSVVWIILGVTVMLSPLIWRRAMTNFYPARVLSMCAAATCLAGAIPVVSSSYGLVVVSATLFGSSFFIAPSAATAFTRRHFPASAWAEIMAIFTILFSTFQALSPILAGSLADRFGLEAGFAIGSGLLLASALSALLQRKIPE